MALGGRIGLRHCYPFGVQWNWNRRGGFCPQSKLHTAPACAEYIQYTQGPIQTRAICKGMCRCTLESDCFGLELLKTQEGKEQKFFCSIVNSETRMFAFHTLFLRTTENCLPRNDLAKFKALHFILERSNMDI